MIELTESFVDSLSPNNAASKNGRDLVKKNKLSKLHHSIDGDLLFGECAGSGSSVYLCSADFKLADAPVIRCSCPSRQFPCKHGLALLYAYAGGLAFTAADVPDELEAKREKAEQRQAQKVKADHSSEGSTPKPRKVNKSALAKKIQAQLNGLHTLDDFVAALLRGGLTTIGKKEIRHIYEQVKQLGNCYLPGAQIELRKLALLLEEASGGREELYTRVVEQLTSIHALVRKGRSYLETKLADPELKPDVDSTIEEWLGHAWQLAELEEYGLVQHDRQLLQLAFMSFNDLSREEYVDTGYWLELASGHVHRTLHYRPYRAAKYMKEEDSFFELASVNQLYLYPGAMNRRVRFEGMVSKSVSEAHLAKVHEYAEVSFAEAVKLVKNELKHPLGNKLPAVLFRVAGVRETASGALVAVDEAGQQFVLEDIPQLGPGTVGLLQLMPPEQLQGAVMLLLFKHLTDSCRLIAQPLTIIHPSHIIRLWY